MEEYFKIPIDMVFTQVRISKHKKLREYINEVIWKPTIAVYVQGIKHCNDEENPGHLLVGEVEPYHLS